MTPEEEAYFAELQKEVADWRPGDPMPKHSLREHVDALQMAVDDVHVRVTRGCWAMAILLLMLAGVLFLIGWGLWSVLT
jgi:hypothetical protein